MVLHCSPQSGKFNKRKRGNAKGRGAAAGISRGRATRSARERYCQNARIGSVHALKRRQRRLQNSGGRTFFGSTCISCGRETTRADGWSAAHRRGWRADGLDGRKGGQLLSFSAAGRRQDCYFTMLVCHACRVISVSRACLRVCMPWPLVRLCKAGMPPLLLLHATPFSCVSVVCAHVVSCIFQVLSCEVDILHFPLLHAVLHSAHGARLVSKQLASPERRF